MKTTAMARALGPSARKIVRVSIDIICKLHQEIFLGERAPMGSMNVARPTVRGSAGINHKTGNGELAGSLFISL
jgi:hypothetical protein